MGRDPGIWDPMQDPRIAIPTCAYFNCCYQFYESFGKKSNAINYLYQKCYAKWELTIFIINCIVLSCTNVVHSVRHL
jgi:hypothetical protein